MTAQNNSKPKAADSNSEAPPPADQPQAPQTVEERLAGLEAKHVKLAAAVAQMLAQQVAPAIQQQIQDKILSELG